MAIIINNSHKIILRTGIIFFGLLLMTSAWAAQPPEEWIAQSYGYDGSATWVVDMAVDDGGNTYVTGSPIPTGGYKTTIKYDTDGNELWVVYYKGSDYNDRIIPAALALDNSGNVYITGSIANGSTIMDYVTIKYDTNGDMQWVTRYDGPLSLEDTAIDLAVDVDGNVYVTGSSSNGYNNNDYATVKYDANGLEQWVSRYNSTVNGMDDAQSIVLDAAGNVIVTGSTVSDYGTIKYDRNGNQLWVMHYNGPGNYIDFANDLAVDDNGNVYVTGYSWFSDYDYATVKYDANGNELWVARKPAPGGWDYYGHKLALDSTGNVYVTGSMVNRTSGSPSSDYGTLKYDSNGNELWFSVYTPYSIGWPEDLVVDSSSNVYVTGRKPYTVGYDTDGNQRLTVNNYSTAQRVALDNAGNLYVAGWDYDANNKSVYTTVKYSAKTLTKLAK